MPTFAQLAVNVPSLTGVFDYTVPQSLVDRLRVGHLVRVPFGKQTTQGVVLRFVDQPSVAETREIIELVDPDPVLSPSQISLSEALARSTFSPLGTIIELFLPTGLVQQADTLFEIRNEDYLTEAAGTGPSPVAARVLKLLKERGPLRGRQLDRHISKVDWRRSAQYLVRRGVLSSRSVLPPSTVRPKYVRTAQLAVSPAAAQAVWSDLGSTESTRARRQKALRALIRQPVALNVSWVYAESGCNLADLQELAERDLIMLRETEIWRDPLVRVEDQKSDRPEFILTNEQKRAWQKIEEGFQGLSAGGKVKPFLLQGVTGSGKTELYLRAVAATLQQGRQAIILLPEISLTPQTVRRFLERFPGQVGLVHSKLSAGERYDTWRRARSGLLKIIIGPRSALFSPLPDIGLIVVDECHDSSYYQSEPPFYNAMSAAQTYARICKGLCIMGSATPGILQRYQADCGESIRLELTQRISSEPQAASAQPLDLPPVEIIDMREQLKSGNRGIFSRELTDALASTLNQGQQAILFLNRRGTSTYVFCRDCGYVVRCPRCEAPLTVHTTGGERLLCHRCGYERQMPHQCPECGGANIRAYGLGSERVEAEVQRLFPKARTLRWDWETTRQKESHEIILSHFSAGRADILIGTQMLAKGLDLPHVTLVGIVLAEVGLFLPDPFAAERVFQLLTQVAGRAGRSSRGGKVVLQTFAPDQYAIQAAAQHDVNGFYSFELEQRRRLGYPPFMKLARLEFRHYDALKAEKEARAQAVRIQEQIEHEGGRPLSMIGPAPCFFSKLNDEYRWQIILRGADFEPLFAGKTFPGWRIEVEPVSLL